MISGLPRKLLLARNGRLKHFASLNGLTNDHDAPVSTIFIFQKLQQPGFSREGTKMNETKAHVSPNVIGNIRRSRHYLLEQKIVINSYMHFDRAYPGSGVGPGHCLSRKDL